MATPFHLEIVTPERVLYSGDAEEVSLRTDEGEIAFLAHHEDFVAAADVTVVRVTVPQSGVDDEGASLRCAVHGGFVQYEQDANSLTILAGVAELASEIDVERARRALEAARDSASADAHAPAPAARASDEPGDGAPAVQPTGASLALLAPDSPAAARARATARLEAAGASTPD